ncbi:MAG: ribbon-helix-helix domain-containing protein [Propionicimonas sp.]|uniref:ribbon-helix-helix domain-containing protein n=1 Tax=Propionicimonas sp. TaxID=1955623 RepID=UPI002B1F5252|nr:ribbon-helix-helix domain-containing protein [Propionicimonas sp.]MEA4945812.1 ribbon-helix-helix domain-containing protein [Propionicimonas sp.]MEA5054345.1 ribbon-helix-helix domain-containing protein [Propionicimonas sp.]
MTAFSTSPIREVVGELGPSNDRWPFTMAPVAQLLQDGLELAELTVLVGETASGSRPNRGMRLNPDLGCISGTVASVSTQIAVRLPDEMVAFLDQAVARGKATSRAALVSAALEREMRRQAAEGDAEVLRRQVVEDDLDPLVDWTAGRLETAD